MSANSSRILVSNIAMGTTEETCKPVILSALLIHLDSEGLLCLLW